MFRIFKSLKPVPLGRWNTDKPIDATFTTYRFSKL